MVNKTLSKYTVPSEDIDGSNLSYCEITLYRQFNMVVCEYNISTVSFSNIVDHKIVDDGKVPSAFRPALTYVSQSIVNYTDPIRNGLISITIDGGMKIRVGVANTSIQSRGSFSYVVED